MMTKAELLNWLQEEQRQWEALLDEIGPQRMELPGVNGEWSMKDIVAHLTDWNRNLVINIRAAQQGKADPAPPWPAQLEDEDEINAWIYVANRERPAGEILDESRQVFQQLLATIEGLPDDVQIQRDWRLVHLGDKRFPAGEFYDHFHDDHEPDVRAWLARIEG